MPGGCALARPGRIVSPFNFGQAAAEPHRT